MFQIDESTLQYKARSKRKDFELNPYVCFMKVKFNDNNQVIEIKTDVEFVDWMRNDSKDFYETNEGYMKAYAKRAVIANNEDIRATSEKDFFEDLNKLGHISRLIK